MAAASANREGYPEAATKGPLVIARVGFIGLGAMGEPMARSLRRAGFEVTASVHRRREALERLRADGVAEAEDPASLAAASQVVILCVPDAPQVEEALFGPRGVEAGAARGLLVIDMSTISPMATRRFAQRLAEREVEFLDAPVSGGPVRAADGTLTIMVGGSPTAFERLVFAREAGADLGEVCEVLASATASNYILEKWLPRTWLAGTFEGGFALDLLRKDIAAALDAAKVANLPMPATGLAYQLYTSRCAKGDGALDYSAIAKAYDCNSGA
jgi:3-hydroxyisobutyrate dehydrogenase-like beta-hydroxyacid dehydrogenase